MMPLAFVWLALPMAQADPSEAFFKPGAPVPTLRIEVKRDDLPKLTRDEPRPYVKATIRSKDQVYINVGLHLKGAVGSFQGWGDKPALTINSDKFVDDQSFHGLDKFQLNNSVQDDSFLNELVFGELFRSAGVPCPRATHVLVELNGRKVGLYVLREGYDKTFLKRHFKNANGNLYDGGFCKEIDEGILLDSGPGCESRDVKALAKAARIEDHVERFKALDKLLDIDKFMAFWALEIIGCDWDGYCRNHNNFRLYHDPTTDKFVFMPHGKDQMFGNTNDALVHNWGGLIARRLWETDEGKKLYYAKLKAITETQLKPDDVLRVIDDYTQRLKVPLNAWQKGAGDRYLEAIKHYKSRVKARLDYLKKEMAKLK